LQKNCPGDFLSGKKFRKRRRKMKKIWTWINDNGKLLVIIAITLVMAMMAGVMIVSFNRFGDKLDRVGSIVSFQAKNQEKLASWAGSVPSWQRETTAAIMGDRRNNGVKIAATDKKVAELEKNMKSLQGDVKALQKEVKKQGRKISALEKVWKKFAPAMEWAWKKWNEPLIPSEEKSSKEKGDGGIFDGPSEEVK
jgi:hypothetical protein